MNRTFTLIKGGREVRVIKIPEGDRAPGSLIPGAKLFAYKPLRLFPAGFPEDLQRPCDWGHGLEVEWYSIDDQEIVEVLSFQGGQDWLSNHVGRDCIITDSALYEKLRYKKSDR